MEKYLDSSLSSIERAKDLLAKLTVREKVEQLNCFVPHPRNGAESYMGKTFGHASALQFRRIPTLEECIEFQKTLQKQIIESSRWGIPAIFHMEGLNGAYFPGATSFPSPLGRGSSFNPMLEEKIGEAVGRQERALGITYTLAPVLDISRDSRMGRQGETYGEDPTLTSALGVAFTKGIQMESRELKSDAVAKHFLASQNSLGGIHGTNITASYKTLQEIHAKPFQAAISKANLQGIMPCYSSFDGESPHTSKRLLTNLLRESMEFKGLVCADYGAIANSHLVHKQYKSLATAGIKSLEAGMDMEFHEIQCYNDELVEIFEKNEKDISILDRAVMNVLTRKFEMGIFENPYSLELSEVKDEILQTDRDVSLQSARESLVLLKNNGVLPIKKEKVQIALIGKHAKSARNFFGGYSHVSMYEACLAAHKSMAGLTSDGDNDYPRIPTTNVQDDDNEEFENVLKTINPNVKNLIEEFEERFGKENIVFEFGYHTIGEDESQFKAALEVIKKSDIAVLTLGGRHTSSSIATTGEGIDTTNINLPKCQDQFILEAKKLKKPLIGIHFDGRPISSDIANDNLDAIIEAWNPSEFGAEAIVDVLTGKVNPSGKMPLSTMYNAGQSTVFYNHPWGSAYTQSRSIGFVDYVDASHYPRYGFGYGLSYTKFDYSNMIVEDNKESYKVTVTVTNTGEVAGAEVVQLYFTQLYTSSNRPNQELIGFSKVEINPNESKTINFDVSKTAFAFINEDEKWVIEESEIELQIGSSCYDIYMRKAVTNEINSEIKPSEREFYAEVEIK